VGLQVTCESMLSHAEPALRLSWIVQIYSTLAGLQMT
jgi:hypothetical protein